eukprot:1942794-Pleurochrysis_carterae.AAC.1
MVHAPATNALVPVPHTPSRCLRALTARLHGASKHALHWPQGASRRRTRSAAATCSTRHPLCSRLCQSRFLAQAYS